MLEEKIILVTGGTSGIGLGTIEYLLEQGNHEIISLSRGDKNLSLAKQKLGDNANRITFLQGDISKEQDCKRIYEEIDKSTKELCEKLNFEDKIVIVDYHAEATAEKIAFAKFASTLGVSAVVGTHTHVQTADEKIIDEKLAYITDVGFLGAYESVIGMDFESSIKRLVTSIPERFDVAESEKLQINAVKITFNKENNLPVEIKRINFLTDKRNKEGET